jgi:hypothetical protein
LLPLLQWKRKSVAYSECVLVALVIQHVKYMRLIIDIDIDIDIFVNCNWVDTRWQYTFTHKQYIERHN